jgi:hypothetical protein
MLLRMAESWGRGFGRDVRPELSEHYQFFFMPVGLLEWGVPLRKGRARSRWFVSVGTENALAERNQKMAGAWEPGAGEAPLTGPARVETREFPQSGRSWGAHEALARRIVR